MVEKYKYLSIGQAESSEIREKGSKFLGLAQTVKTEEEVKAVLESWRAAHPQSTHICYAYRLGVHGELYRANDDGEPNNSAGAPILGQITSFDLTNVLVGVVRYYGGTKLGVGGLISAYKQAAKEVLEGVEKVEYTLKKYTQLTFSYEEMPLIMAVLKRNRLEFDSTEMAETCRLVLCLEPEEELDFASLLGMYKSIEIIEKGLY